MTPINNSVAKSLIDNNFLIKGNNLVALHSLSRIYGGGGILS